jgi:predicted dehydrogenase
MHELAIVGAGQLGSRHLQALAALDQASRISVVEPDESSVSRARSRWAEVATAASPEVAWLPRITELPTALDVAIVATAADRRRAAIEALFGQSRVRHLVLEKVLFQQLADYAPTASAIAAATATAWVNCPRRMWPFYQELRARLHGEVRVTVSGSQWGLGSSAVHFLDLFAYLSGADDLAVTALHATTLPSSRPGFTELVGQLAAHGPNGSAAIASLASGNLPIVVEVGSPSLRAIVREGEAKAWLAAADDGWQWRETSFETTPQSRLTHRVVSELLTTGTCALTPLAASVKYHVAFLEPLAALLGGDRCPIT